MQATRPRRNTRYVVALFIVGAIGTVPIRAGDFYVGASAAADRLNVLYQKVVDNTDSRNFSLNQGQRFRDDASASKLAYNYGFLAGYKVPLSVTGVYVALEGEMLRYGGAATARLEGVGTSAGRNQLGEVWPEDWSFEKKTGYGVTGRVGAGIPFFGTWVGPSVYGLVGVRRLKAGFTSRYTGCPTAEPCTEPSQLLSGTDSFDESFSGWTVGGGLETKVGSLAIRGEVRLTDYSEAGRVIPFDDLFVTVPLELQPDSISFGVTLVWYF